ncbi:hypothetical protein BK665_03215 [Pseudomonas frederiksbergensis]|uniref:Uncharacterized protein n=1 Tax=Pseudomonas frederiksbergensis TaxID=104087 RepID=A0A423KR76_9PSED|nr:hypothetical protein BK665_03215 [Pseudomonas frederiksbergensis]
MRVMAPSLPDRHQPGADGGMCKQNDSLFGFEQRLKLLRQSASLFRRGWPGLGRYLEHGAQKIPG